MTRGDIGNVEQVIMNLVTNARDAMPDGGTLSLQTETVLLDEEQCHAMPQARAGAFVRLSVSDTGTGMEPEVLERIAEPFFSTKEAGLGTGLGLAVVYGIVEQHGGWLHVESAPGRGSIFEVYFPAADGEMAEERESSTSLEALRGSGERVLVVEDAEGVLSFAMRVLDKHGYTVQGATTIAEARAAFDRQEGRFDLVFSDVILPDGNGLDLVDELHFRRPDLPVLLCSGYAEQKSKWAMIRDRGFPFLHKPYDVPTLLKRFRETLTADRAASRGDQQAPPESRSA